MPPLRRHLADNLALGTDMGGWWGVALAPSNLPAAGKSTQPPSDYIEIALKPNAQATIRINGPKSGGKKAETVTGKTDLSERLRKLHEDNPDLAVMISADKEIKYDDVVQVISEAKKQGIARVGLATK